MSVRNFEFLFRPGSVALIGASRRPHSVGAVVARNLFAGGFDGPVMPVNPHERSIEAALAYPSVAALPLTPDLAVICTPPPTIPALIAELGARGTKAAVILSAGFAEGGPAGQKLQQDVLDAARPHLMRLIGPNSLGLMAPGHGLNASFAHVAPHKGDLALIGQSGAVVAAILDWASPRNIGFSHLVSLGAMADVDIGDMLDWLALDGGTRAILLYVEAVTHARKFMSAARAAARAKPVIVIKAGRSVEGARAASSHTGALAGADDVYEAAFRRAGMLRVYELDHLFQAVATLASRLDVRGERLGIVTNGGGLGVLATDRLIAGGGRLAELSTATRERLDLALPPTWSRGNPVDIIGDAGPERYEAALSALLEDPGSDAVLVINCPTAVADSTEAARAVISVAAAKKKPIVTSWVGEAAADASRRLFDAARIPTYDTPETAVDAFMHVVQYRRSQAALMETPPSVPDLFTMDEAAARAIIAQTLAAGRAWLTEPEAKVVLSAYAIPSIATRVAATPEEAATAAAEMRCSVALKIVSPDIIHKSDVGGVELNLVSAEAVRAAAFAMTDRVKRLRPDARLEGFTVQEMVARTDAVELIIGATEDAVFGPVILFGQGGIAVEVVRDRALGLPPLNLPLAHEMMSRTRVFSLLQPYRGKAAADLDAIAATLMKVAQLVIDLPEVAEVEINPLLANERGVVALDARIRVTPARVADGSDRLVIRPYPKQLERTLTIANGTPYRLRAIRPEDEPKLQDLISRSSPEDLRLRFFAPMRQISHELAARLTQIDYDREMAIVALSGEDIVGVVRVAADPDKQKAEYAVFVRSDLKGRGLGWALMQEIMRYARAQGIGVLHGKVLRENTTMLRMCSELGFRRSEDPEDAGVVDVIFDLDLHQ